MTIATATKSEHQSITATITFTFKGAKQTLGTLLADKEGNTTFTEDLKGKGTFVKLGDNYTKNLTVGETYTFTGRAHKAKPKDDSKEPTIYIFNPII